MLRNYFHISTRLKRTWPGASFGLACCFFLSFFISVAYAKFRTHPPEFMKDLEIMEYGQLVHLKPFTSLVGFNGKFCKDMKPKNVERKTKILVFSLFSW
jgi:hypothetical protein